MITVISKNLNFDEIEIKLNELVQNIYNILLQPNGYSRGRNYHKHSGMECAMFWDAFSG